MKKQNFFLFLLLFLGNMIIYAQAPGGVAAAVWYKADAVTATDNSGLNLWVDQMGTGYNLVQATAAQQPTFSNATALANFNPTVTFNSPGHGIGQGGFMAADPGTGNAIINRIQGSIYTAGKMNTLGTSGLAGFDATMDFPGQHISNNATTDKLLFYTATGSAYTTLSTNLFVANRPFVAGGSWLNGAGSTASNPLLKVWLDGNETAYNSTVPNVNATDNTSNRIFRIGGDINWGSHDGQMNEVVVFANPLTAAEKARVDSYLSVKWGTTLLSSYVNSTNGTVWNYDATYQNNILGIARDGNSALYQKQSRSENPNQKLIIGAGNTLANTNAANTNTLTNGQFLLVGDNGLKQSLNTPLSYTAGTNGVTNFRFESIWKVQNTGGVGPVTIAWPKGIENLYLVQSSTATFDSSSTFTPMTTEMTVNGVVYNTVNVTLGNGQYFTFAGYAHAPGGVLNALSYWYRADKNAANTGVGTDVTSWTDYFSGNVLGQMGANALPKYVDGATNYFNFNPGLNFTSTTNQSIGNVSSRTVTGLDYDIFTFTKEGLAGPGNSRVFSSLADITKQSGNIGYWDGIGLNLSPERIERVNYPVTLRYLDNPGGVVYSTTIPSIMYNQFRQRVAAKGLNGALENSTNGTAGFDIGLIDGGHVFGDPQFSGNSSDNRGFTGHLGETIIYGAGSLSATERRRVDSYMAIKYGLTLERVATDHYLGSDAGIVWNGSDNNAYNNNIFGITHDELSGLHQKQSISVNANQKLIIGAGNSLANTNAANTNSLTDGQYLLVGDNGLKQSLTTPLSYTAGSNGVANFRFESIWKEQNTGTVGPVTVAWPKGITNMYLVQSPNDVFGDGDDVFTPMTTEMTVNGVVYNTANVTLLDDQFFTFAGFGNAPGGVATGLSYWYRADVDAANTGVGTDVTAWKDVWNDTTVTAMGTNPLPKFAQGAVNYFNYNPGINFTTNLQTLGNISVQTLTSLNYDIFSLTKEGMSGTRFFNIGRNNTIFDGNNWDSPAFEPGGGVVRRNNAGAGPVYWANPGNTYVAGIPSIAYTTFTDVNLKRGVNGSTLLGPAGNHSAIGPVTGGHMFGRNSGSLTLGDDVGFVGHIGETIVYGAGTLSTTERRKVDSYLAIKYGITLGQISTHYLDADGTLVWNGGTNTTYNNNVFGVAREDIGLFEQKVSKSVNAGTILTVATINNFVLPNLDASRTGFANDKTYFLLGDNNVTATPLNNITVAGGTLKRIQRAWLSQRKNTPDVLYFGADLSAYPATSFGSATNTVWMLVADDAAFTTNVKMVAGTYTSGKWVFANNFNSDNTQRYITFAEGKIFCYKPGITAGTALDTKAGITALSRAGADNPDNWPMTRKGGWLVLEAKTKAFVPNRVAFSGGNPVGITVFTVGMMVYDTTNKCMKVYTLKEGDTLPAWHCISTQACPD